MKFDRDKKIDLLVVVLVFGFSCMAALLFKWKPLIFALPSLVLPGIYLCLREKKNWLKILVAVLIFGTLFGFFFDFLVTFNNGWIMNGLVFQFHLFGFYPLLDDVLGFMIMTFLVIVFYEHFIDEYRCRHISSHIWQAIIPAVVVTLLILLLYKINPDYLHIPYVYLVLGMAAVIRPITLGIKKPRFLSNFLKIGIFFFFIWLSSELVALANNSWVFPGQYIGTVHIAGLMFPFEELIFWMLMYAATVTSYYKCYMDER